MRELQNAWHNLLVSAAALALYRYWEVVTSPQGAPGWGSLPALTACILLFLVTFFRFLRGDEEYLKERYPVPGEETKSVTISGIGRGFDIAALLLHGGMFTGLGLSTTNPDMFLRLFGVLLALNSFWLWLNLQNGPIKKRVILGGQEGIWMASSPGRNAARIWVRNNSVTVLLLIALESARHLGWISPDVGLWLALTTCFANSLVDLLCTWPFYFPSRSSN